MRELYAGLDEHTILVKIEWRSVILPTLLAAPHTGPAGRRQGGRRTFGMYVERVRSAVLAC